MTPRLPIRVRITAAFAAVMLLILAGICALAYWGMSAALLDEIDSGLRFRAGAIAHTSFQGSVEIPDARLQEPREAFEQFLSPTGRVLRATRGFPGALLSPAEVARVKSPTFFQHDVPEVAGSARLLAIPLDSPTGPAVLVVGTSMADRSDALGELTGVLLVGGPLGVLAACAAAWVVAGWALHPMERMRQQAAAISVSGLDRRMPVPRTPDELQRLALTLNDMLDRLAQSMAAERHFLERASHELRTPLAALRAEVDLALRRRRSVDELSAALRSVSEETDRLARLADDLLVLARAEGGRLPLHRESVSLRAMLDSVAALLAARALEDGVTVIVSAPEQAFHVDPLRLRQALVNLLDNALRHTPRNGTVRITGAVIDADVRIAVTDTGPGFCEPNGPPDATRRDGGPVGLGLRIVRAVAESHGGSARVDRAPGGGAVVELVLPRAAEPAAPAAVPR